MPWKDKEKAKAYQREYWRKNPDKRRVIAERYALNRPHVPKQYSLGARWVASLKKYGLTRETWDAMIIAQNGLCGICANPMVKHREPCIDHCHDTGKVRGLLCVSCNLGLGKFEDSTEILSRAILYLTKG